ncbi:transcriptional repressor [Sulfobacillus acidophilus TPY]|uniref:Transcriptional regulator n=1 Tax=Sulfobacillus acidophilus (strain ATCC 700253 / DSM 10332 / NAL) TaxID=679936 RepID=G8TWW1_SULAD|nr:transcriptional repressor [Sulfobacillus acidophilus TPY]AEW03809.1 transcriptional regulator [Sulfobacillus acidophilus DSM 10332]
MASISDAIEAYIRGLLSQSPDGTIVIQRTELADRFDCVPSQISYVLMTRFTPERGYLVEGRRGGGGNIRVARLPTEQQELAGLITQIEAIDQARALNLVVGALESGLISEREALIMQSALKRDVLQVDLPERDRLRARLLQAMFLTVLQAKGEC